MYMAIGKPIPWRENRMFLFEFELIEILFLLQL